MADEADEHWRHTLKAWREKSEKSTREQPGPTQPSLNQADDIEMNVEEVRGASSTTSGSDITEAPRFTRFRRALGGGRRRGAGAVF